MKLYVLRHGIAFNRTDPQCPPDPDRPLTAKGVRRTRRAARGLRALGATPSLILTSPYLRAVQTAEIAADELRLAKKQVRSLAALEPAGDPAHVLTQLAKLEGADVACVGHSPQLEGLLARALGLDGRVPFALKKAGAACVQLSPAAGSGRLLWLLEPRCLRALAGAGSVKPKRRPASRADQSAKGS